jgi:hypothetical protein
LTTLFHNSYSIDLVGAPDSLIFYKKGGGENGTFTSLPIVAIFYTSKTQNK